MYHVTECGESAWDDEGLFDPILKVLELSEFLAVITLFYRNLGYEDEDQLAIQFTWLNAKGRFIGFHKNPFWKKDAEMMGHIVPFENPTVSLVIPIGTQPPSISRFVVAPIRTLMENIAIGFQLDEQTITDWCDR